MTATKSERLLNLVIMLLVSRNYVTKERIREVIEGYRGSEDEAFEKMFERDKAELRALGIPLELGHVDKFFEDEQGYRIARDAFELPDLALEPDEVAVLGLAARVWQHAGLASATSQALVKLRAAGHEVDRRALDVLQPRVEAEEPSFDAMWSSTISRTPVRFQYRRPKDTEPLLRHLEPWGVVTSRERWYVLGFDRDRQAPRLFRLSRVEGEVVADGRPGSFEVPPGTDIRALTANLTPVRPTVEATVLARHGTAVLLRRLAVAVEGPVPGPDEASAWDRLRVSTFSYEQLAGDVVSHLGDVVAVDPPELRDLVLSRLSLLAGVER
ncbi:WYL domain-containing protein [Nocardioides marmoriginsengisoli]|uniref:WYL domain-containing protein n=1 Tax=Nocardioides marmoriginsengisoli TaxID=661483 RepID=A0A3N0CR52_9ACTN|nr:WYL domain-containing protein [Nocardioides marmoriginsengisoli]RNL65761.1 WYL domain-containing protein [Nocardioides marmoriginsengisoli]